MYAGILVCTKLWMVEGSYIMYRVSSLKGWGMNNMGSDVRGALASFPDQKPGNEAWAWPGAGCMEMTKKWQLKELLSCLLHIKWREWLSVTNWAWKSSLCHPLFLFYKLTYWDIFAVKCCKRKAVFMLALADDRDCLTCLLTATITTNLIDNATTCWL